MSGPTVLYPRASLRWLSVVAAVVALAVLGYRVVEDGLFAWETLPAVILVVIMVPAAGVLLASSGPALVLDRRGFRAPLFRWHETVSWRRVATIRLGTYPWGVRFLEVTCWLDAADHSRGTRQLQFPTMVLPGKAATVVDEMQRRRSEATVE